MATHQQIDKTHSSTAARAKESKPQSGAHPAQILQRLEVAPGSIRPADILQLQRTIGNRATGRLLQAKLKLGPAGDVYEQEADRVAQQVVHASRQPEVQRAGVDEEELQAKPLAADISQVQRMNRYADVSFARPEPRSAKKAFVASLPTPKIQRADMDEEEVQAKPNHGLEGGDVDTDVARSIQSAKGGGAPLHNGVRSSMEQGFGADFSGVRVHTGGEADALNRSLNARAFTTGNDIFFGQGQYNPGSSGGQELIAHELTHTVQQGAAGVQRASSPLADEAGKETADHHSLLTPLQVTPSPQTQNFIQAKLNPEMVERFETMASKGKGENAKKKGLHIPSYLKLRNNLAKYIDIQDNATNSKRYKTLADIEGNANSWLKKHRNAIDSDSIQRRKAILWIMPRIGSEKISVTELTDNDKNKRSRFGGEGGRGGMSSVTKVEYDEGIGTSESKRGIFKAPGNTYETDLAPAAQQSGIDPENANFVGRAVAGTVLANLFQSKVYAQTVKSTNDGQEGYSMELAQGVQPLGDQDEMMQQRVNEIDWSDLALQEQLLELQLLDAITGQVDRHTSNYFVSQGNGPTQVKGIDPDLAFGENKGANPMGPNPMTVSDKSVQLPPLVTKRLAIAFTSVSENDVRSLLDGLLTPEEIDQTVVRLQTVQNHIRSLPHGGVVDVLDQQSLNLLDTSNSYAKRDELTQKVIGYNQSTRRALLGGAVTLPQETPGRADIITRLSALDTVITGAAVLNAPTIQGHLQQLDTYANQAPAFMNLWGVHSAKMRELLPV